jgi:hypothetical protein
MKGLRAIFGGLLEWRAEQRAGQAPPLQECELFARDRERLLFR